MAQTQMPKIIEDASAVEVTNVQAAMPSQHGSDSSEPHTLSRGKAIAAFFKGQIDEAGFRQQADALEHTDDVQVATEVIAKFTTNPPIYVTRDEEQKSDEPDQVFSPEDVPK